MAALTPAIMPKVDVAINKMCRIKNMLSYFRKLVVKIKA
jgi:hypothetical protein